MDERAAAAQKRKSVEEEDDNNEGVNDEGPLEGQKEGLKIYDHKHKKRKIDKRPANADNLDDNQSQTPHGESGIQQSKSKHAAKRERKREAKLKAVKKAERAEERKQALRDGKDQQFAAVEVDGTETDKAIVDAIDFGSKDINASDNQSTASPSPGPSSLLQSPHIHSESSSTTSLQAPSIDIPEKVPEPAFNRGIQAPADLDQSTAQQPSSDPDQLTPQQRLEARIQALRDERKADGPDGRPARNRQELLESRRRKEAERRAHKKELQRKAKEDERRRQEEEVVKRFSPGGSASLMGSPRSPKDNNFSFNRVAFADGTQASSNLSSLVEGHRRKGASDPNTALQAAQNKASRLSGLDAGKRADIEDKDMWLNAKKRAHGEKVRDDTNLLKKALKRQEGQKSKSEKEWQGRIDGVEKGMEMRQRKRDENIEKRKAEKNAGKGKSGKGKGKKKIKRPGFEGSFKTGPRRPAGKAGITTKN